MWSRWNKSAPSVRRRSINRIGPSWRRCFLRPVPIGSFFSFLSVLDVTWLTASVLAPAEEGADGGSALRDTTPAPLAARSNETGRSSLRAADLSRAGPELSPLSSLLPPSTHNLWSWGCEWVQGGMLLTVGQVGYPDFRVSLAEVEAKCPTLAWTYV